MDTIPTREVATDMHARFRTYSIYICYLVCGQGAGSFLDHSFVALLVSKVAKSEAGNNVDGINISIGNGLEARGPRALVWFQARQHAWESGGSWVADGVARYAASDAGARLRAVADVVVVRNAQELPKRSL